MEKTPISQDKTTDPRRGSNPAHSVWVSANAGSGKTKVLTDRALRLLLAGESPTKLLAITYTKAAAAEMEARIFHALADWAVADDTQLQQSLHELEGNPPDKKKLRLARKLFAEVLDAPEGLRIFTIHAFCQSILRRFPVEAGIVPHFTAIDEITARELQRHARDKLLHAAMAGEDAGLARAVETLARFQPESRFESLIDEVIRHRRKLEGIWDRRETLLEGIYAVLDTPQEMTEEQLIQECLNYSTQEIEMLRVWASALKDGDGDADKFLSSRLDPWANAVEKNAHSGAALESYLEGWITRTGKRTPKKTPYTQWVSKKFPSLVEGLEKEKTRMTEFYARRARLRTAQLSEQLLYIAEAVLAFYEDIKRQRAYLDFDDLILHTHRLLSRPNYASWVMYKLDGGIHHLLIDEAQDTSEEQWDLVEALIGDFFAGEGAAKRERTLFAVGDEKQSIFSFQGAAPQAFGERQQRFRRLIERAGKKMESVPLHTSFRSTEAVLKVVDATFADEKASAGLIFGESVIAHEVHRKPLKGVVELWPLILPDEKQRIDAWQVTEPRLMESQAEKLCEEIAGLIAGWLKDGRIIEAKGRAVEPQDILILLQRRSALMSPLLHAIKRHGIPLAGVDRIRITDHIAVDDLVALANFLLLPEDDLNLAGLLKSPLIGFGEEALFEVAYGREGSLWQAMQRKPVAKAAVEYLSALRARVDYEPPFSLFSHVLDTLGGRKELSARLGADSRDPLDEFLALALHYEQLHPPTLQGFLRWLKDGEEIEIKRDLEQPRSELRILTVHAAKGLQAPIVILPDTTYLPMDKDQLRWKKWEDHLVPLLPSGDCDAITEKLKADQKKKRMEEQQRLLYVAMTRAEDELYICGYRSKTPGEEKKKEKEDHFDHWHELMTKGMRRVAEVREIEVLGGKGLRYESGVAAARADKKAEEIVLAALPAYFQNPPQDESADIPLSPSALGQVPVSSPRADLNAIERGRIIHRLLQTLPDMPSEAREGAGRTYLKRFTSHRTEVDQQALLKEVLAVLSHEAFSDIYRLQSLAEAPVAGKVDGKPFSGQIDRMVIAKDAIWVIDYKTSSHVPRDEREIPEGYIRQMAAYKALLSPVYPGKSIRSLLLYTQAPKLLEIPEAHLTLAA